MMGTGVATLLIKMTGFFDKRTGEHKSGSIDGFTKKYSVDRLLVLRSLQRRRSGETPRIAAERLAAGEENQVDRETQSSLGRLGGTLGSGNAVSGTAPQENSLKPPGKGHILGILRLALGRFAPSDSLRIGQGRVAWVGC